ncbi:MAG: M20 metallopeptidase family protein [Bacillota bacterium]
MDLKRLVEEFTPQAIGLRREIHRHPELGYEEHRTSALVAEKLALWGLKVRTGVASTGVVADLVGAKPGAHVLLRADMDALPIQEETELPFASEVPGKMHACGHDLHTTIVLGAAWVLSALRQQLTGRVRFVFQPAEECSPTGGAKLMVEQGVLRDPPVDYALALHVWPELKVGEFGIRPGTVSAQSDRLFIKVKGKGGHASAPHQGIDAIVAAAQVICTLQTVVSRRVDPRDSVVITIGKIQGGERYNVICDLVEMEGTVRILSGAYGDKLPAMIQEVAGNAAKACGADAEVEYVRGYPMTVNHPGLAAWAAQVISRQFGPEAVREIQADAGGEDFAFIAQRVPSLYIKLGAAPEESVGEMYPLHHSKVVFDERCIPVGIKTLCLLVLGLGEAGCRI